MESGSNDPRRGHGDEPPPPPPPPGEAPAGDVRAERRAGALARAGTLILAFVLAFGCAVMVLVMLDIGDSPRCDDQQAVIEAEPTTDGIVECFDGGKVEKVASLALGWPGAVLAGVAALMALVFTVRGLGGRKLAIVTVAAIALSGLSILVGSL